MANTKKENTEKVKDIDTNTKPEQESATITSNDIQDLLKMMQELKEENKRLSEKIDAVEIEKAEVNHNSGDADIIFDAVIPNQTKYDDDVISPPAIDELITIVSLCFGSLNLSTEPYGKGRLLTFNKFGETKRILYGQLIDIVNTCRKFAEEGRFFIADKRAVRSFGLDDVYENILKKEIFDDILKFDEPTIKKILERATEPQKKTLIQHTLHKMFTGKTVDINRCILIGDLCGVNIMAKLDEMKELDAINKAKQAKKIK